MGEALCISDSQGLLKFLSYLLYLGVEISAHSLLGPRLEVDLCSVFLLWVTHHISDGLEVPALGLKPVIDETLRVSGKAQQELSLGLQQIDSFCCLMDLVV